MKYENTSDKAFHVIQDALSAAGFYLDDAAGELISRLAQNVADHPASSPDLLVDEDEDLGALVVADYAAVALDTKLTLNDYLTLAGNALDGANLVTYEAEDGRCVIRTVDDRLWQIEYHAEIVPATDEAIENDKETFGEV